MCGPLTLAMQGHQVIVFAIYCKPPEFPRHFVVRRWVIRSWGFFPERIGCLADSLDDARASIPGGLRWGGRCDTDHTSVVETWL